MPTTKGRRREVRLSAEEETLINEEFLGALRARAKPAARRRKR